MILYKAKDIQLMLDKLKADYEKKYEFHKENDNIHMMRMYGDMRMAILDFRAELIELNSKAVYIKGVENE